MATLYANGEPQCLTLIDGPNHVALSLLLADEPTAEPLVVHSPDFRRPELAASEIRQAVARGIEQAHAEYPLRWYPRAIRISIEHWSPRLVSQAARDILTKLAAWRSFGTTVPVQISVLHLIGWGPCPGAFGTSPGFVLRASTPDRVEQMRTGHAELIQKMGEDFGYALARWREYLLARPTRLGYRYPGAFDAVDLEVQNAIADPEFHRLGQLAAEGDAQWRADYWSRERARRADACRSSQWVVARGARLTRNKCPNCGKPCPTYRRTCRYCCANVRATRAPTANPQV